jgi:hypothetical protein
MQPQAKQQRLQPAGAKRLPHHVVISLHPLAPPWLQALQELPQCRGRAVRAMAADAQGVACLITRYVAPVSELPPGLAAAVPSATGLVTAREAAMLRLARFVALVPFIDDAWVARAGWALLAAVPLAALWPGCGRLLHMLASLEPRFHHYLPVAQGFQQAAQRHLVHQPAAAAPGRRRS